MGPENLHRPQGHEEPAAAEGALQLPGLRVRPRLTSPQCGTSECTHQPTAHSNCTFALTSFHPTPGISPASKSVEWRKLETSPSPWSHRDRSNLGTKLQ